MGRIDEKTFVVYVAVTYVYWSADRTDLDTLV
jgi:hypothetical protein